MLDNNVFAICPLSLERSQQVIGEMQRKDMSMETRKKAFSLILAGNEAYSREMLQCLLKSLGSYRVILYAQCSTMHVYPFTITCDVFQHVFILALMDVNQRFIKSHCQSEKNSYYVNAMEQCVCYFLPSARKISAGHGRVGEGNATGIVLHHFEEVSNTSSLHTKGGIIASFCLRLLSQTFKRKGRSQALLIVHARSCTTVQYRKVAQTY